MNRLIKFSVTAFVVVGVLIFAAALAGGLADDRAFTPAAKEAAHTPAPVQGSDAGH